MEGQPEPYVASRQEDTRDRSVRSGIPTGVVLHIHERELHTFPRERVLHRGYTALPRGTAIVPPMGRRDPAATDSSGAAFVLTGRRVVLAVLLILLGGVAAAVVDRVGGPEWLEILVGVVPVPVVLLVLTPAAR